MATRRKERPLTLEEIKEKINDSTDKMWMHSEPLCGFTPLLDGGKIISVSPKSEHAILALFFVDITDYTTGPILERITQWLENYRKLPWLPILVIRANYLFLTTPKFFDRFKNSSFFNTLPVFIDEKNEWFQFLNVTEPSVVFMHEGQTTFKMPLHEDFSKSMHLAEIALQNELRSRDTGLPLLEPEEIPNPLLIDHKKISVAELTQSGYWAAAGGSITTEDPHAMLSFAFQGNRLRIIAITHPQARDAARALVTIDDHPVPKNAYGAQLHTGDRTQSIVEVNRHTGIYEIISSENAIKGTVTLKFLNTLENPVVVYGLRIV